MEIEKDVEISRIYKVEGESWSDYIDRVHGEVPGTSKLRIAMLIIKR